MKADGSRLIPRKHTETLVLLSVEFFCLVSLQDIFWDRQSDRKFRKWLVFNHKYAEIGDCSRCW